MSYAGFTHKERVENGRKGGRARAKSLSKRRRHEIALAGGLVRQLRARLARELNAAAVQAQQCAQEAIQP